MPSLRSVCVYYCAVKKQHENNRRGREASIELSTNSDAIRGKDTQRGLKAASRQQHECLCLVKWFLKYVELERYSAWLEVIARNVIFIKTGGVSTASVS